MALLGLFSLAFEIYPLFLFRDGYFVYGNLEIRGLYCTVLCSPLSEEISGEGRGLGTVRL